MKEVRYFSSCLPYIVYRVFSEANYRLVAEFLKLEDAEYFLEMKTDEYHVYEIFHNVLAD